MTFVDVHFEDHMYSIWVIYFIFAHRGSMPGIVNVLRREDSTMCPGPGPLRWRDKILDVNFLVGDLD